MKHGKIFLLRFLTLVFPFNKETDCTSCQYTYYDWNSWGIPDTRNLIVVPVIWFVDYLKEWKDKTFGKNATAKKYETGGGSAGTGRA